MDPIGRMMCRTPIALAVRRFDPALELVVWPPDNEKAYDTDEVPLFQNVIDAAPVQYVSKREVEAGSVCCDQMPTRTVCPAWAVAADVIVPE